MSGADQEDVAAANLTPCSRSHASRSATRTWSPGSSQATSRWRRHVEQYPAPDEPVLEHSIASTVAPSAVNEFLGRPL